MYKSLACCPKLVPTMHHTTLRKLPPFPQTPPFPFPSPARPPIPAPLPPSPEFIQLLSSESNEVATREGRSIIHPDHVMRALTELGFQEFVGEVNAALHTFKEETKSERA